MKWLSLLFITLLCSCAEKKRDDCLEQLCNDYPGYGFYVVIPKSLCKSCSSTYPSDLKEAYSSGKIKLVLNCENRDTPAINYYLKDWEPHHLIIDSMSLYTVCDSLPESMYPAVAYVKNNILKVEYYNKDNAKAYEKLKRKVLE